MTGAEKWYSAPAEYHFSVYLDTVAQKTAAACIRSWKRCNAALAAGKSDTIMDASVYGLLLFSLRHHRTLLISSDINRVLWCCFMFYITFTYLCCEGGACCPDILRYVTVNVTTNAYCANVYPARYPITADMICATDNTGGNERDSCQVIMIIITGDNANHRYLM